MDKLRNYFLIKASVADNLLDAANSLKGLSVASSISPFIALQQQSNSKCTMTFKDQIGNPAAKPSEQIVKYKLVGGQRSVDVTDKAKVEKDSIQLTDLNIKSGRYQLQLTLKGGSVLQAQQTFDVTEKDYKFKRLHYQLTETFTRETEKDTSTSYPNQLKLQTASDGHYLHIEVEKEGIEQMYLTFIKTDYLPSQQVSVTIPLDSEDHVAFAFDSLNLVNGEYKVTLIGHSGSGQTKTWSLGTVKVWFKEGQTDVTNNQL